MYVYACKNVDCRLTVWAWLVIRWLRTRWVCRKSFHRLTAPISFPPGTNPGGIALKPLSSIHPAALVGVACNRILSSLALVISVYSDWIQWWVQVLQRCYDDASTSYFQSAVEQTCKTYGALALALRPQHIHPDALSEDDLQVDILCTQRRLVEKLLSEIFCMMFCHVSSWFIMSYLVDDTNQSFSGSWTSRLVLRLQCVFCSMALGKEARCVRHWHRTRFVNMRNLLAHNSHI